MPHFIIDCSAGITTIQSPETIMQAVYDAAENTNLFAEGDIKVRINAFTHFKLGRRKDNFIHVFGNIMEGRTVEQKTDLSHKIVSALKNLFPNVPIISMNIREFEKATYCNRSML